MACPALAEIAATDDKTFLGIVNETAVCDGVATTGTQIEVIVDELEFMSSRNDSQRGGSASYAAPAQVAAAPVVDASSSVYDEDLPF